MTHTRAQLFHFTRFVALILVITLATLAMIASCERKPLSPASKRVLSIAAAASLKPALDELVQAFAKERPDVTIETTIGASGAFSQQIAAGAPFDLFLSADAAFPQKLVDGGHAASGSMRVYGANSVSLVLAKELNVSADIDGVAALQMLGTDAISKVALADPRLAPTGAAGQQALEKLGVWSSVEPKLVMADNAERVIPFFVQGGAPAVILPTSLAREVATRQGARLVRIPGELHDALPMALIVPRFAKNAPDAQAFSEFLASPAGWSILATHDLQPTAAR